MTQIFTYIVPPLLGGLIGYITNDIAIRMLFRPHTAKYIFGFHVPFTPGIIPKEKGRIAESIGDVISKNLMNREVLEKYLLSEDILGKLHNSIQGYCDAQMHNEETVSQFLGHYLTDAEIAGIADNIQTNLTQQASERLVNTEIGEKVAHVAVSHIVDKFSHKGATELIADGGGLFKGIGSLAAGLMGPSVIGRFLNMLREPTERYLAKQINQMLDQHGEEMVSNLITQETTSFLDKRVCDLLQGHEEQLAQVVKVVENIYRSTIEDHLPRILESVDISKIVRERIEEMDVNETEKLILQVMDKELKTIVWLGALLGMIMGCINIVTNSVLS